MDTFSSSSSSSYENEASESTSGSRNLVTVIQVKRLAVRKFRVERLEYQCVFNPNGSAQFRDIDSWYFACFEEMLQIMTEGFPPNVKIGLKIDIPSLADTLPIVIHFHRIDQLTPQMILDRLVMIIQSNRNFEMGDKLLISVTVFDPLTGGMKGNKLIFFILLCFGKLI